jgi:hypothetical protein
MKVHSLTCALLALLVSAAVGQDVRKVQPDAENSTPSGNSFPLKSMG